MTYAAPPPAAAPQPPAMRNGFGITALCLAIPSVVFGFVPLTGFVAFILGALALIFGLLGVARVRKQLADNKVMSWIASGLGAVGLALGIWGMTIFFSSLAELERDLNQIGAPPAAPAPAPSPADVGSAPLAGSGYETAKLTVKFDAWGAGTADITYTVGSSYNTPTGVTLPWSQTAETQAASVTMTSLQVTRMPSFESYSAGTAPTGEIGCRLTMNGTVVEEHTATGDMAMVTCDTLP